MKAKYKKCPVAKKYCEHHTYLKANKINVCCHKRNMKNINDLSEVAGSCTKQLCPKEKNDEQV